MDKVKPGFGKKIAESVEKLVKAKSGRVGRVVECSDLRNRTRVTSRGGSNPSPAAPEWLMKRANLGTFS